MDILEIKRRLAQDAEGIARYLLPNGKREGQEWRAGSIHGEAGSSLGLHLSGSKAGLWKDFAGDEGGDLIDLWKAVRGISLVEALNEIKDYLGIIEPTFEGHRKPQFTRPSVLKCHSPASAVRDYLLHERRLSEQSIKAYQIQATPAEDAIIFPYLRDSELIMTKTLKLKRKGGKKQMFVSPSAEPSLFGWQAIDGNARTIVITEGEIDALSAFEYGRPALSMPFGGGTDNKLLWIEYEYDRLERFETIYICVDGDEVGKKTVGELARRLGYHRCRIVHLPCKDMNECRQMEVPSEVIDRCFDEAQTLDPEELKNAREYLRDVLAEFYGGKNADAGCDLPWSFAQDRVKLRPSELSIWTGPNGCGKSMMLGHIMLEAAKQGERICIASMEMKPKKTLYRLTRQAAAMRLPSEPYIEAIHAWYADKFWLFDVVGTAKAERILDVFEYARKRYGITHFVIDSLMKCGIAEDDYRGQKEFLDKLADFKNAYDCHVHLVAHARKGEDIHKPVDKWGVKGTGAITDLADNVFAVWRNKKKEDAIERGEAGEDILEQPDAMVTVEKQRNGEWEGKLLLAFDRDSFQYLDRKAKRPTPYVDFSNTDMPVPCRNADSRLRQTDMVLSGDPKI